MHWYGGSIAEAVTLSKQRNAIFVVFVEGDNELSTEMAATIDHNSIVQRLSNESNFLAIKLKSGSPNYTHFAQIYQFVPVPSLFFIGRNGTPLEVVCAGVEASNLAYRIDRILEEHNLESSRPQSTAYVRPSTSSQNIREQTSSLLQAEADASPQVKSAPVSPQVDVTPSNPQVKTTPAREIPDTSAEPAAKVAKTENQDVSKVDQDYEVVCDGDVCVRKPKAKDEAGPSQRTEEAQPQTATEPDEASTVSMEEKLERAKELIEARRREKAEKEKELEKQKELERRSQGQGVAELKKWQADQELKNIQEERKREKKENDLARQRILEQIAQDRAERRARDLPPAQVAQPDHTSPAAHVAQQEQLATSGDGTSRARVQFKLPDGTSHTAHFDADGTLGDIHRYIADNLQLTASSFSLWTAFPRRELTETDATLRRLELAPSAALLVLPRRQPTQVAAPSAVASLVAFFTQLFTSLIVEPSQQLLAWFRSRLFPPPPATPATPTTPATAADDARQSPAARRRGNIHRLPGDRPADDDNNTWNGNSTQQM